MEIMARPRNLFRLDHDSREAFVGGRAAAQRPFAPLLHYM